MNQHCTELLLKFRDMARIIWNVAFWPNPDLQSGDCFVIGDYTAAFDEAMARLFEGMVLLPLGRTERVEDLNHPGTTVPLFIEIKSLNVQCLIDQNLPSDAGHIWRPIGVPLDSGSYEFHFRGFFDWDQLGHRDFNFIEVLVRRMDTMPDAVGHHALIPASDCSAWVAPANSG
jgi:hypothetical protein